MAAQSKISRSNATEDEAASLAEGLKNGDFQSYRHASANGTVCAMTVRNRALGLTKSRYEAAMARRTLTPIEEASLIHNLKRLYLLGYPPTLSMMKRMAEIIIENRSDVSPPCELGINWASNFNKKHPSLKVLRSESLEMVRKKHSTPAKIRAYFQEFAKTIASRFWYRPRRSNAPPPPSDAILHFNIYNMDETGVMMGKLNGEKVIVPVEALLAYSPAPSTRESATAIECICADGTYLDPMIIFAAKTHRDNWYKEHVAKGWTFGISPSGYTDEKLSYTWLVECFHPQTVGKGGVRVLLTDGHSSHFSADFMEFCFDHDILLFRLPSHTTHLTQPLDLKCFSPLKHWYRKGVSKAVYSSVENITKDRFLEIYEQARKLAFTQSTILSAWEKSGLYPFNPDIVLSRFPPEVVNPEQTTTETFQQALDALDNPPPRLPPAVPRTPSHSRTVLEVRTPRTTYTYKETAGHLHQRLDDLGASPTTKRLAEALEHGGESAYVDRSLLHEENEQLLFGAIRKEAEATRTNCVLGKEGSGLGKADGRVMTHADLMAAKARKQDLKHKKDMAQDAKRKREEEKVTGTSVPPKKRARSGASGVSAAPQPPSPPPTHDQIMALEREKFLSLHREDEFMAFVEVRRADGCSIQ